jgi:hypothetical protein
MASYKVAVNRHSLDRKLPHGDPFWPVFNASFQNLELEPFDLGRMIYDGHAFTTWHGDNWRHSRNFIAGQHLALDFDSGDKSSTLKALLADRFIGRYAALLYTTPSHTPEKPKARAVFLLDTPIQQAKNYALAAQSLLWAFDQADPQCKDPARFFYGSLHCEMEMPYNELPLDVVKRLIAQRQEVTARESRARSSAALDSVANEKYITAALRNEVDAMLSATQGTRNATLNRAVFNLGRFVASGEMSETVIEDALADAARKAGLGQQEIAATLRSALKAAAGSA